MHKQVGSFLAGLSAGGAAIALTLAGCTSEPAPSSTATDTTDATTSDDSLQVVTTFLPITYFTEAVAGDRATVTQLLPLNVDPHDYQAKPNDVQRLADADVLVENGLELESFLDSLIDNAANAELVVIDSSEGIPVLPTEEGAHDHASEEASDKTSDKASDEASHDHDSHDHDSHDDHDDHDSHEHDSHEHSEASHDHDHGIHDPHLWLDPQKAIQQVENIRDGLIAADPEGETIYTANAADYIADLEALDTKIREQLAPYAGKAFVTYHDFAEHFAHSYGLEVEYLVDIPEGSPTPTDVQRVVDTVKASNLQVLLTEPSQQGDAFGAIASDLDVYVSVFDSMESTGNQNPQPEDYISTLSKNSDNLARAFGEPPE
ncbi:metal ABC transporter solute-binding protein, Zn/Mn family [cf. Phormidesmis sp. LEGE 11477]|uniref:metal ABC transporter solute-binding protein, Zn/Mn family n=1 Tax=cf. Phormidesmis sp. LEGE 11477 TaxID=1828680 RepID=UPI00187F7FCE|nr:zinc ABC transporter substrate-binding protein [cf. Phormidesmis sp. LEGE 11477]MBE9062815.1 zinc ABC transporter substrate-binding protein [cf. Phormidesmis sp. LEGE 11477]